MHATKTGTPSSKRAPAQQLQSSYNNNNNSDRNDAYINNMNNNSNINLPPECSSLLESPTPYYYGRNNRQYEWALNSPQQQQHQQQQQHHQLKQPPPLPFAAAMISPPTPDKPSAWKTTLKHANTATAQANQYYTQPQQQHSQQQHQQQYKQQHVKKRVHFAPTAKVHPIDSLPRASDMTNTEKAIIWYLENDYNNFKHDAASDGGVKIIRRISVEAEKMKKSCGSHGGHYVLIGSFDGDADTAAADRKSSSVSNNNDGSNHSSDAATAGSNRSSPSGKFYNEHEYNDYIKANGQTVCKRGLGYHFSRIRKRNRAMTRSAVLAWQKSMEKEVNKKRIEQLVHRKMQASSSSSSGMHKSLPTCTSNIHSQVVIALVSSKCSRVSREEALWRGNVDFRVAYPERRYLNNLNQPEENMTMQSLFHQHGGFNFDYNIQKKRSSSISGGDLAVDDDLYHSTKKRRSNLYDSSTTSAAAGYAEV